jgi:hypothetical protein
MEAPGRLTVPWQRYPSYSALRTLERNPVANARDHATLRSMQR